MSKHQPAARVQRTLTILNDRGLHARASAKFVKCAEQFQCRITVSREGQSVPGTSIMGLMMLAAHKGTAICVSAVGGDAKDAVEALAGLIAGKFGEDDMAEAATE